MTLFDLLRAADTFEGYDIYKLEELDKYHTYDLDEIPMELMDHEVLDIFPSKYDSKAIGIRIFKPSYISYESEGN